MNLLTNFKCCFDEVRTGVTKFPIKTEPKKGIKRKRAGPSTSTAPTPKAKDLLVYKNLVDYGLNNQHIPLLQGITFPPERRTGLLRSIGPMSQAILLINETRYFNKLTNALRSSLQMLPMKEEIIVALKNATSPGSVAGLLKELGDLLLLSTARSTQKIFYPISVWRMIWAQRGDSKLTFSDRLDPACLQHDLAYRKSDLATRHKADYQLEQEAWKRVKSADANLGEKAAAWIITFGIPFLSGDE